MSTALTNVLFAFLPELFRMNENVLHSRGFELVITDNLNYVVIWQKCLNFCHNCLNVSLSHILQICASPFVEKLKS